jgi:hypothetical protein
MPATDLPTLEGRALADLARQLVVAREQIAVLRAEAARLTRSTPACDPPTPNQDATA